MFSVLKHVEKRKEEALFYNFFFFQNGRRTHFPKQPAGLFYEDGRQFFFLYGPHLDSGYDISLFRAASNILRKK